MSVGTVENLGVAGPYDLITKLGAGGMGEVFLARHRVLNREAVIKRILPEHTGNDDLVRRFVVEAQAAGKLSHRNVVEVRDITQSPDGRWYLVLEYLRGLSLADWMHQWVQRTGQPVGPWYATIILSQAANALNAAHAAGIVHRDVKPENIFLTNAALVPLAVEQAKVLQQAGLPLDLFVKLLDFGIAKLRGAEGGPATQTGVGIGTISYMAPEQFENAKDVGPAADVYSLGVVAFQLLTGGALPWGDNTPAVILYRRQTSEPPPDVRALVPALPADLAAVVRRALSRSPLDRPSAHELALAFARAVPPHGDLPSGIKLLEAYAGELAGTPPDARTIGRIDALPVTAPQGRKAPAPAGSSPLPNPTPWLAAPLEPITSGNATTHGSAIQVRPSVAAAPSSGRRTLLLALAGAGVLGAAVVIALTAGGGAPSSDPAPAAVEETAPSVDADTVAQPEPTAPDAGTPHVVAPVDAAPPLDAAPPVDAQQIDAGRRNRTRPPPDTGDGSGTARGFRDLTK